MSAATPNVIEIFFQVQSNGKTMWEMDHERKQLYFTQFGDLPDLNLTNPDVVAEFKVGMLLVHAVSCQFLCVFSH